MKWLISSRRKLQAVIATFACLSFLSIALSAKVDDPQGPTSDPAKTAPQVLEVLNSYNGQTVSTVELAGRPDLDTDALKSLLSVKPGDKFSRDKVNASAEALKRTGQFHTVQLQVIPDLQGVRVMFVLEPGMYIGMYTFPGAIQRFAYSRLLQVANYPPQGPYTPVDVENARQGLIRYFQRNGYFTAEVAPRLDIDKEHGIVNVAFDTKLGKLAKFGKVNIEGPNPQESARLNAKLKGIMARLRGAAIREGKKYRFKTITNATQRLTNTLVSEDHLDAQVTLIGANYDPATNRADIALKVEEGPIVKVKVEGTHLWPWTKKKLIPLYQEVGVDNELIQEGRQNIISHLENHGYFQAKVNADVQKTANGETVVYTVTKGPRNKVDSVNVAGNHALEDANLNNKVVVKKGNLLLFNHGDYSDKLVRQSVKNLESTYKAAGFSSVKVSPQVRTESDGDLHVTFMVDEGVRDVVESIQIVGNNSQPIEQLAPKGLNLAPGQPYSQKLADEDRTQITANYLRKGYLNATFRETLKTGSDKHHLVVTYNIDEGPQVTVANVYTIGRKDTKQKYIDVITYIPRNKPLTETEMLTSESQLYEPGIFDWAEVDPRRHITTQSHEDVVVKVHEAKKNTMIYGFGFEVINRGGSVPGGTVAVPGIPPVGLSKNFKTSQKTFWGPRGTFEYTRNNFRGKAESISFAALGARLIQRGTITYHNPNFRYSSWSSSFNIMGENNLENPIFSSRIGQFGWELQKPLNSAHTQNLFLRYSYRQTGIARLLIPGLVPPEDMHVRLSTLSATFTRDTRDNILDAHKGIYESFEVGFNPQFLGSSVNFTRVLAQTAYFKPIWGGTIWANSLRLGFEPALGNSHVPISEEYFSGGGSTLRGFPLNGAGPQHDVTACGNPTDPTTCAPIRVPLGGRQLVILNSEFRIPVPIKKGLGVVAFYDGGNVFRSIGFHGQYTNTIGTGLRYATPVGPVRIDIGHNLNAPAGIKATQFFITLGQAF